MRKILVGIAAACLVGAAFLGLDHFVHECRMRELPWSITTEYSDPKWSISEDQMEPFASVDAILSQRFTYLGKGSQSYVYLSEDGSFVLKFLKQNKLRPNTWLAYLAMSFNPFYQKALLLEKKKESTFAAIKLGVEHFKNETGILYAHLNTTDDLNKKLLIVDRKGKEHAIDLDPTCFLIQKKANLIYPRITELMEHNDIDGAKRVITSVFELLSYLGYQGVVDNDPILRKNFGLIQDQAIQIDIGRMKIDPMRVHTLRYKQELDSITHSFKVWIEKHYPELLEHFCLIREGMDQGFA